MPPEQVTPGADEHERSDSREKDSSDRLIHYGCLPALLLPVLLILGWALTIPNIHAIPLILLAPLGFIPYLEMLGMSDAAAGYIVPIIFSTYLIAAITSVVARKRKVTYVCIAIIITLFILNVKGCHMMWDQFEKAF